MKQHLKRLVEGYMLKTMGSVKKKKIDVVIIDSNKKCKKIFFQSFFLGGVVKGLNQCFSDRCHGFH